MEGFFQGNIIDGPQCWVYKYILPYFLWNLKDTEMKKNPFLFSWNGISKNQQQDIPKQQTVDVGTW